MITQQISLLNLLEFDQKKLLYLLKKDLSKQKYNNLNKMLTPLNTKYGWTKMGAPYSGKTTELLRQSPTIDKLKKYNTSKILVIQSKDSDKEFLEKNLKGKFITSFDNKEYWYFKNPKLKVFVLLRFNTIKCDVLSRATAYRYNKSKVAKCKPWYQKFSNVYNNL